MKQSSASLKAHAKRTLNGKYGTAACSMLVIGLFVVALVVVLEVVLFTGIGLSGLQGRHVGSVYLGSQILYFIVYMLGILIIYLFEAGQMKMFMNMVNGQSYELGDMIYVFTHHPLKFIGLYLILALLGFAVSIPTTILTVSSAATFFIPVMVVLLIIVIIFQIAATVFITLIYSQAMLILLDHPEYKVLQCLKQSRLMMRGNKGRLLYLWFSFLGMVLLAYGSFLIGLFWVGPYISCTMINFYNDLKSEGSGEIETYENS